MLNLHSRDKNVEYVQQASSFLDLDGTLQRLPLLLLPRNRLGPHDTAAPMPLALLVLLGVTFLDGRDQLRHFRLVLGANFGKSEHGGSLQRSVSVTTIYTLDSR